MLFKLSNLNSNLALTLGYLNPALNNSALNRTVVDIACVADTLNLLHAIRGPAATQAFVASDGRFDNLWGGQL